MSHETHERTRKRENHFCGAVELGRLIFQPRPAKRDVAKQAEKESVYHYRIWQIRQ